MDALHALLLGLATSAALIAAIGAQNAFVLRQGLRREHVGAVVAWCAACDAVLMGIGVAGVGRLIGQSPQLLIAAALGGGLFLCGYGALALWRAVRPGRLLPAVDAPGLTRRAALLHAAAFTLLNPHVYLDTVLLVGTVGGQQPPALRWVFWLGASLASVAWFAGIGHGARSNSAWR